MNHRRSSEALHRHQYVDNRSHQPFTYSTEVPTLPRTQIQYDTDAITQSRSFQILQGWISESEKVNPIASANLAPSPDPASEPVRTSFSSLPSRSFRHLQDQYRDHPRPHPPLIESNPIDTDGDASRTTSSGLRRSTDPHMPSRAFRYLQDQLPINRSLTVNNRDDLAEIYNRVPPSIRAHEPEAPRYRGSAVPSRSFRFLQRMTEDNQETDGHLNRSFSLSSSTKSE